jgi:hypothetical protein
MLVRLAVSLVWLALAYWAQNSGARALFAYAGAIVACVHVFGAVVGFAVHRAQGGWDFSGLAAGVAIGIVCGIFAGRLGVHSAAMYWASQIVAAAFLIYLPLI